MRFLARFSLAFGVTLAMFVAAPHAAPQVPTMKGTAVVFGTVVADATGRPIKGAFINVIVFAEPATFSRNTTTDRDGRFVLSGLAPGQARIAVTAPGYLGAMAGQGSAGDTNGTYISLADGQIAGPTTTRLRRGAVISGRVLDEASEPFGAVQVQAFSQSFSATGRRVFTSSASALTNDQGDFRIANLTPGAYIVGVVPRMMEADTAALSGVGESGHATSDIMSAFAGMSLGVQQDAAHRGPVTIIGATASQIFSAGSPVPSSSIDGKPRGYAPTFFPGVPAASAAAMTVSAAEEKMGVVFQLIPVVVAAISGHIVAADGTTPETTALTLVPQGGSDTEIGDTFTVLAGASGEFSFGRVPAGGYVVEARNATEAVLMNLPSRRSWASVPVTVGDTPQSDLAIKLHEGVSVSGEVHFVGANPAPTGAALTQFSVRLAAQVAQLSLSGGAGVAAPLDLDRRFVLDRALVPGDYRLTVGNGLPNGWSLASMTIAGHEITDGVVHIASDDLANVVITMTDRATDVSGALTRPDGTADTASTVIVFPQDRALWTALTRRIIGIRPTSDGRYQVKDLPPGDYFVVATPDVERGQWFDLEFLASIQAKAMRITLAAGEQKTLDLKAAK